mmetsp:Transcript_4520/g.15569  ORF Transcript_4520/g.15569 Transcript_4520/m.15569 type:complete len:208 (+) Transcript_4520:658-1281(+)
MRRFLPRISSTSPSLSQLCCCSFREMRYFHRSPSSPLVCFSRRPTRLPSFAFALLNLTIPSLPARNQPLTVLIYASAFLTRDWIQTRSSRCLFVLLLSLSIRLAWHRFSSSISPFPLRVAFRVRRGLSSTRRFSFLNLSLLFVTIPRRWSFVFVVLLTLFLSPRLLRSSRRLRLLYPLGYSLIQASNIRRWATDTKSSITSASLRTC